MPRRRFALKTALESGGSATAYIRIYDRENGAYSTTDLTFTVYDADSMFDGTIGTFGKCTYWPDSGRWEIDQLQCG